MILNIPNDCEVIDHYDPDMLAVGSPGLTMPEQTQSINPPITPIANDQESPGKKCIYSK